MPSRGSRLPKHVYVQRIGGRVYYRFRKAGGGSVRLPGNPDTPEFHTAYARLISAPTANIGRYTPGSVAHTIEQYFRSAEWGQLKPGTQRDYTRYLLRLDRSVGERALEAIDSEYVFMLRDRLQKTPSAANHAISVMGALFRFAIARKVAKADPTAGVGKLKCGDGYERWTDADISQFRACEAISATMQLALSLGLYTGQRLSDVIRLAWSNYDGERIRIRQQKTGTRLSIPIHEDLKAMLGATPRKSVMVLTTRTGMAFHPRVFSRDFLEARKLAQLPAICVSTACATLLQHGLLNWALERRKSRRSPATRA